MEIEIKRKAVKGIILYFEYCFDKYELFENTLSISQDKLKIELNKTLIFNNITIRKTNLLYFFSLEVELKFISKNNVEHSTINRSEASGALAKYKALV